MTKIGGCFWISVLVNFPSPNIFVNFVCRESWWGHCPWIIFSQIYFILLCKIVWSSVILLLPLFTFLWTFFLPMRSSVLVLCFFSQPDVNITWITGHIHRSIVDKIEPTSEYVEMAKKNLINYIGLHIFVNCDQKNLFTTPSIYQ